MLLLNARRFLPRHQRTTNMIMRSDGVPVHVPHHGGVRQKSRSFNRSSRTTSRGHSLFPGSRCPKKRLFISATSAPKRLRIAWSVLLPNEQNAWEWKHLQYTTVEFFRQRTAQTLWVGLASPFRWTQRTSWQIGLFGPDQPMPGGGFSPNQQA